VRCAVADVARARLRGLAHGDLDREAAVVSSQRERAHLVGGASSPTTVARWRPGRQVVRCSDAGGARAVADASAGAAAVGAAQRRYLDPCLESGPRRSLLSDCSTRGHTLVWPLSFYADGKREMSPISEAIVKPSSGRYRAR
jgi:hypothetical protein